MATNPNLLEIRNLSLNFGGIGALNKVDLNVKRGLLFSLIGPNGAGKTSLVNCISKFYIPKSGKISFNGRDITSIASHDVVRCGISRTFQNIELFKEMTVLDNIKLGRHIHLRSGPISGILYWGKAKKEEKELEELLAREILSFLDLSSYKNRVVGTLSYGLQKRVDLARALACKPELLILDEPVAGMNREETKDMIDHVLQIKKSWGLTVFLIEHDMEIVMNISDWIAVMNFGEKMAEGTAAEVQKNPEVIRIYLGKQCQQ
ncbi:MAG: ABC transporter ATP-binding protein [Desulfobacteraceae bacterium]|nr:MAG: ABC transporter ATP-binding protein [Desulfobacteraceae bacterium]